MKMKWIMAVTSIAVVLACSSSLVFAQETDISSDKAAIKAQKDTIKENASSARQEEKQLRDQIQAAEQSGDSDTAKTLREQLKTMHQENVEQRKTDRQDLNDAKKEFRSDKKEARIGKMDTDGNGEVSDVERQAFRQKRADTNNDGKVDQQEIQNAREKRQERQGQRRDNDNNPPGPRGGKGTNWENRPGPQGGPGASPNKGNNGVRDHGQRQGRHGQGGGHRGGNGN